MSDDAQAISVKLENPALCLSWEEGKLRAQNRLSGRTRELSFPAFALRVMGEDLSGDSFALADVAATSEETVFSYQHEGAAIEAEVKYRLEEEKPWFRKQLVLRSAPDTPTPDRVWVDVQEVPPAPLRRVGYGLRGGPDAEEQTGLDTYGTQPGCGYPVYADDWFIGLEHPAAFTVPGERLELFHHPVWDDEGVIESFPAVYGAASHHHHVAQAFMDYLWHIRLPRLSRPFVTITVGWCSRALGHGEYLGSFEANEAFVEAMLELGLRPDALAIDAGYFERRSLFRHKGDDDQDSRFIAFAEALKEKGLELSLWVSHNGRTGFDMDWIKSQGWKTGEGPAATYSHGEYVIVMQPEYEEALAQRFERLVGEIGARHLKIDWDNECATSGEFAERYPTPDHVREASIKAFNRIDRRMRAKNPELVTRNGWWPSPWWLQWANHVWLVNSGDCEYASWPSRTQRDREITHRDAMYYQITRRAETPCPLEAFDDHGFTDALDNCFAQEPHTWLDNVVLAFTRGTTYLHMALCPEAVRQWQADMLQQALDWMHHHADELGTPGTRMVGGNPAFGEVYGFLHPSADSAWLVLRNPSPQPQSVAMTWANELGYAPRTMRQVHPFWQDLPLLEGLTLLGHEVRLIRLLREPAGPAVAQGTARSAAEDLSPIPGVPFMVQACEGGVEYSFPGNKPLTDESGPTVHPDMQIPEVTAEKTADQAIEGGWRLQWYAGIPHRFERAELLLTLRGPQEVLDAVTVRAGSSRYRGGEARHILAAERIFRKETRGYGTARFLPPVGPRERDDYVFKVPDGGWSSLTVDLLGEGAASVRTEAWITGYEARARRAITRDEPPADGPLLPPHPYGFARCMRI